MPRVLQCRLKILYLSLVYFKNSRIKSSAGSHSNRSMLFKCHSKSPARLNEKIATNAAVIRSAAMFAATKERVRIRGANPHNTASGHTNPNRHGSANASRQTLPKAAIACCLSGCQTGAKSYSPPPASLHPACHASGNASPAKSPRQGADFFPISNRAATQHVGRIKMPSFLNHPAAPSNSQPHISPFPRRMRSHPTRANNAMIGSA